MSCCKTVVSLLCLVVVGVGVAPACKGGDAGEKKAATARDEAAAPVGDTAKPDDTAKADDTAKTPPPRGPDGYELSATRIGPIVASTPATTDLANLFPGHSVIESTESIEGEEYPVIKVMFDDDFGLLVSPHADGKIDRVRVTSPRFRTALGAAVGSSFAAVDKEHGPLSCTGGADAYGGSVLCRPEDAPTLAFVFEAKESDAYYARPVPAEAQAPLLTGKKVREILWQPARQAR